MNRRDFIRYCGAVLASTAFGHKPVYAKWIDVTARGEMPLGMMVIDAHSHPLLFPCYPPPGWCDLASTPEKITQLKMNASCFAVTGDSSSGRIIPYDEILQNLNNILALEEQGELKIIRRHSDLPHDVYSPHYVPGALLGVEGIMFIGDKLDELYGLGVRLMTLMHYHQGEVGDIMTQPPVNGGLTDMGKAIVEKMCSLGIIIDAAHAHVNTLKPMTDIALAHGLPVIDSHTGLIPTTLPQRGRLRTFDEMEMVVRTGGIVCLWPLQVIINPLNYKKTTFEDWAKEIRTIADRFGIEHVGIGTDGGGIGYLGTLINGYESILDFPKLVDAMDKEGFKRQEIQAFFGGNMLRVMKAYM